MAHRGPKRGPKANRKAKEGAKAGRKPTPTRAAAAKNKRTLEAVGAESFRRRAEGWYAPGGSMSMDSLARSWLFVDGSRAPREYFAASVAAANGGPDGARRASELSSIDEFFLYRDSLHPGLVSTLEPVAAHGLRSDAGAAEIPAGGVGPALDLDRVGRATTRNATLLCIIVSHKFVRAAVFHRSPADELSLFCPQGRAYAYGRTEIERFLRAVGSRWLYLVNDVAQGLTEPCRKFLDRFGDVPAVDPKRGSGSSSDARAGGDSIPEESVRADADEDTDTGTDEDEDAGTDEDADAGTDEDADAGTDEDADAGTDEDADAGTDEDADAGTDEDADADAGAKALGGDGANGWLLKIAKRAEYAHEPFELARVLRQVRGGLWTPHAFYTGGIQYGTDLQEYGSLNEGLLSFLTGGEDAERAPGPSSRRRPKNAEEARQPLLVSFHSNLWASRILALAGRDEHGVYLDFGPGSFEGLSWLSETNQYRPPAPCRLRLGQHSSPAEPRGQRPSAEKECFLSAGSVDLLEEYLLGSGPEKIEQAFFTGVLYAPNACPLLPA